LAWESGRVREKSGVPEIFHGGEAFCRNRLGRIVGEMGGGRGASPESQEKGAAKGRQNRERKGVFFGRGRDTGGKIHRGEAGMKFSVITKSVGVDEAQKDRKRGARDGTHCIAGNQHNVV